MGNVKIRTVNQPPLDKPSIHVMSQKEVVDNVKLLESIEEIMQPVRLEYVQLKRLIGARFYFGVSKALTNVLLTDTEFNNQLQNFRS